MEDLLVDFYMKNIYSPGLEKEPSLRALWDKIDADIEKLYRALPACHHDLIPDMDMDIWELYWRLGAFSYFHGLFTGYRMNRS